MIISTYFSRCFVSFIGPIYLFVEFIGMLKKENDVFGPPGNQDARIILCGDAFVRQAHGDNKTLGS